MAREGVPFNCPISGVVLAGGSSERMGRDKATVAPIEAGFPTLLDRQLDLLRRVGVDPLLLSVGSGATGDSSVRVVRDASNQEGPLGGIVAAQRIAPRQHLLVLAVDMGAVELGFLRRLIASTSSKAGAVPRVSGRWEPLCAVYPPDSLSKAEAMLNGPTRSPSQLVEELYAEGLIHEYEVTADECAQMKSWNTPKDLPHPL